MELSSRVVCLLTLGLQVQAALIAACDGGQSAGCQHIMAVNAVVVSIIPIPDPDTLDDTCSAIQSGLECVLSPSAMGTCEESVRAPFVALSKVLEIPCFRAKQEYLDTRTCWKPGDFGSLIKTCYFTNIDVLQSNFCFGGPLFRFCILDSMLSVPGCDARSQHLFDIMVSTWYNSAGQGRTPTCPELEVPSLSTTTVSATSRNWTTVMTMSTASTDSADLASSRTSYESLRSVEQVQSTASGDAQSVGYDKITGNSGISVLPPISSPFDVFVIAAAAVLVQFFNQNIIFK